MKPDRDSKFPPESENPFDKTIQAETTIPLHRRYLQTPINRDLPDYHIIHELGQGTSGIIYEAEHKKLGRKVAIKMLHPQYFRHDGMLAQFRKEAHIISRIKHENIASVYDFVEKLKRHYIIMELIHGPSLSHLIKDGQLSEKEILHIMRGLLEGIRYSHQKDILHLDLKPSNIIINEYNDPVIVDFGLSRFGSDVEAKFGKEVMGTPLYMAPEQYIRGNKMVDFTSDIYSLGIIFYQLLAGVVPFNGETFAIIRGKVLINEPISLRVQNSKVSHDLDAVVSKMIRKNPAVRYPDAQSVIDDLKRYTHGEPVRARDQRWSTYLKSWIIHNRAVSLLTLIVILVLTAFGVYFKYKKEQETPRWSPIFSEEFNREFSHRWHGFMGNMQQDLVPIRRNQFPNYFANRIHVASFKKDEDLTLLTEQSFEPDITLRFQWAVNPGPRSKFGFFINGFIPKKDWGYIFYWKNDQLVLLKNNFGSAPLWTGHYRFESHRIYNVELEAINGLVTLTINKEKIVEFQDFDNRFPENDYRMGFFATEVDLEIDQVHILELDTALLISPLDIGNRLSQLGQYEEAIQEYSRVIAKYLGHPIAIEAYYLKGLNYQYLDENERALEDFDYLLTTPDQGKWRSKAYYQRGVCLIKLGHIRDGCIAFDNAIKIDDIPSIRANVVNVVVNVSLSKLSRFTQSSAADAEELFRYLISLNVPYKLSYVELPKKILLYYFDAGDYQKCIQNLDRLKTHYSTQKDIVAFSLWKKGRAYIELNHLRKMSKDPKPDYISKAIQCFETVLSFYPEISIYNYFSCEELSFLYRQRGEFKRANQYEKKMMALKKSPDLLLTS